jgi:hypothetical protein
LIVSARRASASKLLSFVELVVDELVGGLDSNVDRCAKSARQMDALAAVKPAPCRPIECLNVPSRTGSRYLETLRCLAFVEILTKI